MDVLRGCFNLKKEEEFPFLLGIPAYFQGCLFPVSLRERKPPFISIIWAVISQLNYPLVN